MKSTLHWKVVASVVGTVASNLGITIPAEAKPSPLQTEQVLHRQPCFNAILFCSCRRSTGAWRSSALASASPLKTTWLSGQSPPPLTTKEKVYIMCVLLFQGLCQHLLRVAVSPSAQSKTLCPKVVPSRINLQLDHWWSNNFQIRSRAAKLVCKKDYHTFQPPFCPKKGRR